MRRRVHAQAHRVHRTRRRHSRPVVLKVRGIAPSGEILRGQNNTKGAETLNHVGSIVSHILSGRKGTFGCDLHALKTNKPLVDS